MCVERISSSVCGTLSNRIQKLLPAMIKKLVGYFRYVFTLPMPLSEFSSYDEYWRNRQNEHDLLLFRYRYVANLLPENGSVLDVGCGDGRFLKYLHTVRPSLRLLGVDGSPTAVYLIRKAGIEARKAVLGRDSLDDLTGEFDYVVAMEILEHIENAEEAMRQLLRLRAKRYYVTIPNLGFIGHRMRLALGGKTPLTNCVLHVREHVRFWTASDFRYWADHMGFSIVFCRGLSNSWLRDRWPSLWCRQLIFVLKPKNPEPVTMASCGS